MAFEIDRSQMTGGAVIKVIGVGGCGGNAVNNMIERGIVGVEFVVCNTDQQALINSQAHHRVQLGTNTTKGLGAGFNPAVGKRSAEENRDEIAELIRGTDMLFITAGMGKGTGTGAAPVIAAAAKKLGILTIGIVTKPFEYEGEKMTDTANKGIEELRKEVDTLIVVQNEKIFSIASDDISTREAYNIANDVLYRATKGIAEIVTKHGHVNVDFADVRNVMSDAGEAVMGSATASGESRAVEAAAQAISSPLLDGVSIKGSTHILVNITGDVKIRDMKEALSYIKEQAGPSAQIIHGVVEDDSAPGEITVTVIATGFNKKKAGTVQNPQGLHVVRRNEMLKATGTTSASPSINGTSHVEEKLGRINSDVFEKREELPAFIRAGNQLPIPLEQKKIEEKFGEEKFAMAALEPRFSADQDRIRKTNSDTPAFLRKILD